MNIELYDGGVVSPRGFAAASTRAGLKTQGDDLLLICAEKSATAAAVFTRNLVQAAPVKLSRKHIANASTRAILANAGNANCCTGAQGERDALQTCEIVAAKIGCKTEEVLVCSTGIIGHQLPFDELMRGGIEKLSPSTRAEENEACARAIMTTDTRPKFCAARAEIGGAIVTVGGQAKGAGMIAPNMGLHATMLAFLTTDAQIEKPLLQRALEDVTNRTFNCVTIDGDTSTNDTAILLASGASGAQITEREYSQFAELLETVCKYLARELARDGEGATRLVEITVGGAQSEDDAHKIAMTVANSPLVKCAIFGGDPNWGRLAAAAGRAGVSFDASQLSISIGELEVFRGGEPAPFSQSDAEAAVRGDENGEVKIHIKVGNGEYSRTAWTCDFSYGYIRINAEYHT